MQRMSDKPTPPEDPTRDPLDGPDNEWVRVKHPRTGAHYSTTRALARIAGATLVPDHPALTPAGEPVRRKPNQNHKEA
jgi:hypothetical protein